MIKTGDKVKYLNAVGGGVVTGFSGKNMATVEDDQGFEVPVLISQLVSVDDNSGEEGDEVTKVTTVQESKKEEVLPESIMVETNDAADFYLTFVPDNAMNPVGGEMKAFLVNGSSFMVLYNYSYVSDGEYISKKWGRLDPGTKLLLDSFSPNELNNLPDFFFQLMFFRERSKTVEMPVFKLVKVNPVKFYKEKSFSKNAYFAENACLISIRESDFEEEMEELTNKEVQKAIREKQEPNVKKAVLPHADLVEVDLHINELLDDTRGLSNHEMLEIQMKTFREKMEEAIKNGVKRIVFIHGVGNGTLKQEIRQELSRKFRKYAFQDASFQEYGFGATMVILKK